VPLLPVRAAGLAACLLAAALALPARAEPPAVSAEPSHVVLGNGAKVTVTVRAAGAVRALQAATSVGALAREADASDREARFTWTPPTTLYPQVALLAFWLPSAEGPPEVAVYKLPLAGTTELEVKTAAKATVRVEVGGKIFGPVKADARGRAQVPIEVPPDATRATVLGEAPGGSTTSVAVPLGTPPSSPLLAVLSPTPLHAGGKGWLWILHPSKLDPSRLQLQIKGGKAARERVEGDRALYAVTPSASEKTLSVTAVLKGDADTRTQAQAELIPAPTPPPEAAAQAKPDKTRPGTPPRPGGEPLGPPAAATALPVELERLVPSAWLGGYAGGAANHGLGAALGAGYRLPMLDDRLTAELEVGLRGQTVTATLERSEVATASVTAVPVEVGARYRVLQRGPWGLDARAGGGLVPFTERVASSLQPAYSLNNVGAELYAAAQASFHAAPVEVFLEVRGAFTPAWPKEVPARPSGLLLALGARFDPGAR